MKKYKEIEIFRKSKTTLKKASYDDANNEYMTEYDVEVIDFDKVKELYCSPLKLSEPPKSCDVLLIDENNSAFIEFKNGEVDTFDIRKKIYESLLILADITKCTIGETREKLNYILVYNEESNRKNRGYREFAKNRIPSSKNLEFINQSISGFANKKIVKFRVNDFQTFLFKDVDTYTKEEFKSFCQEIFNRK